MNCPNCHHISDTALLKCSACGEVYERTALEQFQHLEYLLTWLEEREQAADVKADAAYVRLREQVIKQHDAARAALHLAPSKPATTSPAPSHSLEEIAHELALTQGTLALIDGWLAKSIVRPDSIYSLRQLLTTAQAQRRNKLSGSQVSKIEPPSESSVIEFTFKALGEWEKDGFLSAHLTNSFQAYLTEKRGALIRPASSPAVSLASEPTPAPKPAAAVPAIPAPKPTPKPAPPPKPAKPPKPPINWGKVWERAWGLVVSGALLRGLLYLGAFMIVVSAIVLVVAYWGVFPWPVQLGFIAAVPLVFYAGGFFLRSRLKIPVAGGVFTGIGAILVAVDFAAVYQIGGLSGLVDLRLYWLIASVVCTAIYVFTAWHVRGEFFAYLTLIGLASTLVALVSVLRSPLEWRIATIAASGAGMMALAGWLKQRASLRGLSESWGDLALASRRLPHLLIPVSLFLVVLVPGDPAFGQMAAFLFAALGYGLLAEYFPAVIFVHASAWCSVGAFGFALFGLGLPAEWYAAAAAALAPLYFLIGRLLRQQLIDFTPPRRGYRGAVNLVGFGLVIVAIVTGSLTLIVNVWAGVTALVLASAVLAWCAYSFRRPALAFIASGLFIAPFTVAVARWLLDANALQWGAWLMAAWAGLALVYLGLAVLARRAEKYVTWLNLWAHALTLMAALGLSINYAAILRDWYNGPTLIALGGLLAVYIASALIHNGGRHPALSNFVNWLPHDIRQDIFLWPVGLLIPVWIAIAWWGSTLQRPWFGAALAGLALVYVGAGQLLGRRKPEYRFAPHVYAYLLSAIGVILAISAKLPLMTTLYLVVAVMAALAVVYRRNVEATLAAALFLWPFYLSLQLLNVTPHAYALAYVLLASFGYTPLGLALDKVGRKFALPQYAIGYGLAALSVVASLGGRFNFYPVNVQWVSVAVPLIVAGLQLFSLYRFRQLPFAWAAAGVFPLAFGQALTLLRVPPEYDAAAWVGLAFVYLLIERGLVMTVSVGSLLDTIRERSQSFRWPLGLGAIALCCLGLSLTAPDTARAFAGLHLPDYFPPLLAQAVALALVVIAARLHHSRWPLFFEPPLAFVAVTLFFIGYSERLLGVALVAAQFGIIWSILGIGHLVIAAVLDRNRIRYSHGLYLGGYALVASAVYWTLAARDVLLWTLGLGIVAAIGSALSVHFNRHHSWDELMKFILVETFRWNVSGEDTTHRVVSTAVRGAFIWLAAWLFPIWCVLLLQQLNVAAGFYWLGFGVSALALLGLAVWLRRYERTYAWPLNSAAQFYTALGLIISAPLTFNWLAGQFRLAGEPFAITQLTVVGFIVLQTLSVIFYAASARAFRTRLFAYAASALAFFPYTLGWIRFAPEMPPVNFALAWVGLAVALSGVGFPLDRQTVRYAHGPYLAGYALAALALIWSVPDRVVNIYTLAIVTLLALVSHTLAHYGRHQSFDDFVRFIWREEGTVARRAARTIFLFFAAYAIPVWLAQFMAQLEVQLAWRGLGLALAAPIYVAFGLATRRVRAEYTWPLYSAGYALTAIGAMVSFENEALVIYVLALDAVVYAASAYIFRQSFWLYLSNTLLPIVTLLTLHYNAALTAPWVAGLFMGLAFVYFFIGQWFNRRLPSPGWHSERTLSLSKRQSKNAIEEGPGVSAFALAFYAPAYG